MTLEWKFEDVKIMRFEKGAGQTSESFIEVYLSTIVVEANSLKV